MKFWFAINYETVHKGLSDITSFTEEIHYHDQFVKILQAFGQSFLQPDLNIFRQNVTALENLNAKWKLFSKKVFMESLSHQVH